MKRLYIRGMPDLSEEELNALREALAQHAIYRKMVGLRSGSLEGLLGSFLKHRFDDMVRPIPTVETYYSPGDIEYRIEDGSFRHPVRDPPLRAQDDTEQQQEAAIRAAEIIRRTH